MPAGLGAAAPPWDLAAPAPRSRCPAHPFPSNPACPGAGRSRGASGRSPQAFLPSWVCKAAAGASSPSFSGVGLAFLFSWLLILLVFATFLVGGNIQTLVCRNWVNQEIYKVGGHA